MDIQAGIDQLYPGLSYEECEAWIEWVKRQDNYYISKVGNATCITKVYNQIDPPWLRVGQEVAWWGHGREAVRALHRGMEWARLQGASHYCYSTLPNLNIMKWRKL